MGDAQDVVGGEDVRVAQPVNGESSRIIRKLGADDAKQTCAKHAVDAAREWQSDEVHSQCARCRGYFEARVKNGDEPKREQRQVNARAQDEQHEVTHKE